METINGVYQITGKYDPLDNFEDFDLEGLKKLRSQYVKSREGFWARLGKLMVHLEEDMNGSKRQKLENKQTALWTQIDYWEAQVCLVEEELRSRIREKRRENKEEQGEELESPRKETFIPIVTSTPKSKKRRRKLNT